VLGVDISKEWFDVSMMDKHFKVILEQRIINRPDEILTFISEILDRSDIPSMDAIFMSMEHTGLYIQNLVRSWMGNGGQLAVIPASQISESMAGSAGWVDKSDTLDARRIAEYTFRFMDKLECYKLKSHTLEMLQRLQRQRTRLLNVLSQLEVPMNESYQFDTITIVEQMMQNQAGSIAALKKDLKTIDKLIQEQINLDPYLKRIFKQMKSVVGVGPVTATEIIIATEGFTKFSPERTKMFSRYAGVVPLPHTSGKSIRKKPKTTKRANSHMKKLLTMGALSAIKVPGELQEYYRRKILEGKHHMCVLNAIRNKIIMRVFAVVRRDSMYEKEFSYMQ
jgi:transposase